MTLINITDTVLIEENICIYLLLKDRNYETMCSWEILLDLINNNEFLNIGK
jgi:hypothetical protein